MAILTEIQRIENAANKIKTKTEQLGLTVASPGKLDNHADAINAIPNQQAKNQKLTGSSTSVDLPVGYYGAVSHISVDTLTPSAVTLSGQQQTISCKDKMMTDNIVIPAANVYYTGNTAPDSNTPGNNGDIYLVI